MDNDKPADDLDQLLGELDAHIDSSTAPLSTADPTAAFTDLVGTVARSRGSDLFLVSGSAPMMRIDGKLVALAGRRLSPAQVEAIILPVMDPQAVARYRSTGIVDT